MAVTSNDLALIYPSVGDSAEAYLRTANVVVATQLSDKGLDVDLLDQVTLYLAAHFATVGNGILRRQRLGDADESYNSPGDKAFGFKSTMFGQQAMLLDTSGTLASMGANAATLPALFQSVGTSGKPWPWICP